MRYHEITSGLKVAISNEEYDLIDKVKSDDVLYINLSEREQEIYKKLHSRGILYLKDGIIKDNNSDDLWRI